MHGMDNARHFYSITDSSVDVWYEPSFSIRKLYFKIKNRAESLVLPGYLSLSVISTKRYIIL